jgi:hypothetical protein
MTDQPPKRIAGGYASLRDAFRAAEEKRAANIAAFFGQPEPTDEPLVDADNIGDDWGTGASGDTSPASLDAQMDDHIRRRTR